MRLAVADGMPAAVEALERLRDLRLVKAAGAGASRLWRVPSALGAGSGPGGFRVAGLRVRYACGAAGDARGGLDAALRLHAQVLGVAPDDIDDVVAHALARVFGKPQVEPVADPSQPPE